MAVKLFKFVFDLITRSLLVFSLFYFLPGEAHSTKINLNQSDEIPYISALEFLDFASASQIDTVFEVEDIDNFESKVNTNLVSLNEVAAFFYFVAKYWITLSWENVVLTTPPEPSFFPLKFRHLASTLRQNAPPKNV